MSNNDNNSKVLSQRQYGSHCVTPMFLWVPENGLWISEGLKRERERECSAYWPWHNVKRVGWTSPFPLQCPSENCLGCSLVGRVGPAHPSHSRQTPVSLVGSSKTRAGHIASGGRMAKLARPQRKIGHRLLAVLFSLDSNPYWDI